MKPTEFFMCQNNKVKYLYIKGSMLELLNKSLSFDQFLQKKYLLEGRLWVFGSLVDIIISKNS